MKAKTKWKPGAFADAGITSAAISESEPQPKPKPVQLTVEEKWLLWACDVADWEQVVANGGPPCFYQEDGRFCLRAKRWCGHDQPKVHSFVSLHDLIKSILRKIGPDGKIAVRRGVAKC